MAMLHNQRVSCNGFSPFQHDVGIEVSVWYLLKRPEAKSSPILVLQLLSVFLAPSLLMACSCCLYILYLPTICLLYLSCSFSRSNPHHVRCQSLPKSPLVLLLKPSEPPILKPCFVRSFLAETSAFLSSQHINTFFSPDGYSPATLHF